MCAMLPLTQVPRGGGKREHEGPQTEGDRECTVALGLAETQERKRGSGRVGGNFYIMEPSKCFSAQQSRYFYKNTRASSSDPTSPTRLAGRQKQGSCRSGSAEEELQIALSDITKRPAKGMGLSHACRGYQRASNNDCE